MIYTVENTSGNGKRCDVFVNGNRVDRAIYADTGKGIVKYYPKPARVHKLKEEVYTRVLRGKVTVEFIE